MSERESMAKKLFMVVERFKGGDAVPVYRRFREQGRLAPEGLTHVSSWVNDDFTICFQVMESIDPRLLEKWMSRWSDLVEFEVHPVMTSKEALERIAPKL